MKYLSFYESGKSDYSVRVTHLTFAQRLVYSVISIVLCAVNLLLPIERGFPAINIVGYPVNMSIIASLACFVIIYIESGGNIWFRSYKDYLLCQFTFILSMLVTLLISPDFEAGIYVIISYISVFCLNLITVYYLFERGFMKGFVKIICSITLISAGIGVIEGLFQFILPFYYSTYTRYDYDRMSYEISRSDHRVLGTLGNPIVYSVALVLTMPFVFRLKNAFMRVVILLMIFIACLLTQSRTSVIMFAVIILVEMKIWRKSINIFLVILVSIVCCVIYISMYGQISFYDINEKLIYRDPQNITIRYDIAVWALSDFFWRNDLVGVIFGSGIKSSVNSVYGLGIGQMNTIDNNYVTVLYEYGVVGFVLYCSTLILVLRQGWKRKGDFFFPIVAYFLAGFSFVVIYYLTCNFFWTAIVAGMLYAMKNTDDSTPDGCTPLSLS